MQHRRHGPARLSAAIVILVTLAACERVTDPTRSISPVGTLSRVAIPASGRHIFTLKDDAIPSDFAERVRARGGEVVSAQSEIGVVVTTGLTDADASVIAGTDSVAPDFIGRWVPTVTEMQLSTVALSDSLVAASARRPEAAPLLPLQWNMRQIHAPEAWAKRRGSPRVRVAILDSGLDPDHLDQAGLIDVVGSVAFVPSTTRAPAWGDDNGHGTFVGGIVTSNNIGMAGVAPDVTLIAVKVLDKNGVGPVGATIDGVIHATKAGAQIINMSLGLYIPRDAEGADVVISAMRRAINYATRHGAVVVSSAGNENRDLKHDEGFIELPCEAGVQVCVSATGPTDARASYSNYGINAIDVAAPGGDGPQGVANWILGPCSSRIANPAYASCANRGSYVIAAGTSAAAPHVAGLAAYLDAQLGGRPAAALLIPILELTADDLGPRGRDQNFGNGRINVARALGIRMTRLDVADDRSRR